MVSVTGVVTVGPGLLAVAPVGNDETDYRAMLSALYDDPAMYPFMVVDTPWVKYGHAVALTVNGDRADVDVDDPHRGYGVLEADFVGMRRPGAQRSHVMLAWFPDDRTVSGFVFKRVVVIARLVT